jgi:plasmid stability protein
MADILVRNVPEPLRNDLKRLAEKSGKSLSEAMISLIRLGLSAEEIPSHKQRSALDVLDEAIAGDRLTDEEYSVFEAAVKDLRSDKPRPVENFE